MTMTRAAQRILRRSIIRNRNAKHIKEEYPDFPEVIPNSKKNSKKRP